VAKVTSKLQVTIPKAVADALGIVPGSEVEWIIAGDAARVIPLAKQRSRAKDRDFRLALFDQSTKRQSARERTRKLTTPHARNRGWRREQLYERGGTR